MTDFIYNRNDNNTSFEGLNGGDTLTLTGGIDPTEIGFLREGDDLVIKVVGISIAVKYITLKNHFTDNNSRIETINFDSAASIDLTNPNIIYDHEQPQIVQGTNNDDVFLSGLESPSNIIYAKDGNDIIYANDGNETVYMGNGDDIVYAASRAMIYNDGDGNDTIYKNANGIGDALHINYSLHNQSVNVDLTAEGADDDNDGITDDILVDVDDITGTAFNDTLRGTNGLNDIYGGDGDDIIYGDGAEDNIDFLDRLYGEAGDDIIYGGDGLDFIFGGTGTNSLFGNAGRDIFFFYEGYNDIDGGDDHDKINFQRNATNGISADLTTNEIDINNDGINDGTAINIEELVATKFNDVLKGNNQYNLIDAGGGDDIIYGSAGSDDLDGGSGNDVFIFENISDYANNQYNTIKEANIFNVNDKLDISNILEDAGAFDEGLLDPLLGLITPPPPITNFVRAIDDGEDTMIEIDTSGNGNNYNQVVLLENYTGHGDNAQDMIDNGYLIIQ